MQEEKRKFTRVPFRVKAEMTVADDVLVVESINNLSVGGCLLAMAETIPTDTECFLKIFLSGTTSEVAVAVDGRITWCEAGAVAVKFTRIEPDSLVHLQNIVRYNYPDTDKVEEEINNHPGVR